MQTDLLNIGLAFLEGLGLIVSPCILPILPIVLSGSLEGGRRRPFGITAGFVLSFSLFTLFSRALVQHLGIDINIIREASYVLLALLGIVMLSSFLTERFTLMTSKLSNIGSKSRLINQPGSSFSGGLVFGALIGLIWTPCAGPILAAVIVQSVLQHSDLQTFFFLFAFGLGAGIPMLLIALFGRNLLSRFDFLKSHTGSLRKILGLIILGSVAFMVYSDHASNSSPTTATASSTSNSQNSLMNGLKKPYPAPDFDKITTWINSPALSMASLKGKVVLIDFWTFSCINCIRTLPYIKEWNEKYHDKGLVIIGVHAPEFEFEKNIDNVKNAVKKLGILYPVAIDNDFGTWLKFKNRFWPAHFLIDPQGQVVYEHFGEGDYDITENNIRYLLKLSSQNANQAQTTLNATDFNQTPETYVGYSRVDRYAGMDALLHDKSANYQFPASLATHQWALNGNWKVMQQSIQATLPGAAIEMEFHAKKVFLVLGNKTGKDIPVSIQLNGKALTQGAGSDVQNGQLIVSKDGLYNILDLPNAATGLVELKAEAPGLEVYTFTFGN